MVPNICATIPLVGGTVDNHKKPNVTRVTFGFLWLSTVPPTNGIVAHIFGTKYVALLYGIVFVSHQIGSFLGAYLGGVFYELNGNFDYAWYGSIALSIFAGLIHLPIIEKAIERTQLSSLNCFLYYR